MLKSSLIALGLSAAFVTSAACSSPEVMSNGGSNNNGTPGGGGSGYMLPDPGTGGPSNPNGPPTGGMTPTDQNNCGVQMIDLKKRPADLLLVLDRSTSMLQDAAGNGPSGGNGPSTPLTGPQKWKEVVDALDPVVMQTQDKVAWGLKMFPMGESCGVPSGATVPVAPNSYPAVLAAIRANPPLEMPRGSTPTRVAVEKAAEFMAGNTSANSKYLVLATDGLPNCGTRREDAAMSAIAAVGAAAKAGIPSFIVGIATAGSDANDTLNEMAIQGGRPRNDATKYYPVSNKDDLVAALGLITGQIASCTFPLATLPPQPDNVRVNVDGAKLNRDTTQAGGWDYGPGGKSVVLYGPNCEALKDGSAKNVQILYGCPGRIVE